MSSPAISLIVLHYWQINPGSILKEGSCDRRRIVWQFPMSRESDSSLLNTSPVQRWKVDCETTSTPHAEEALKRDETSEKVVLSFSAKPVASSTRSAPVVSSGLKTNTLKAVNPNPLKRPNAFTSSAPTTSHYGEMSVNEKKFRWVRQRDWLLKSRSGNRRMDRDNLAWRNYLYVPYIKSPRRHELTFSKWNIKLATLDKLSSNVHYHKATSSHSLQTTQFPRQPQRSV